jgi:hypothetical protein
MSNNDASILLAGAMGTIVTIVALISYLIQGLAFYKLAQKANLANAWFAWVPILQYVLFLHLINKSGWNILLLLIPIANVVLAIIWYVKFFNAFGMSGAWVLLVLFVQIGLLILLLVMAFSETIQYKLTDNKYVQA